MSSGRPKKKHQKKHKSNRQVEALKQTVQSSPVRTELSPYNRDYVDLLPATVLKSPHQPGANSPRPQAAKPTGKNIKPAQAFAPHLVIAKAVTAVVNRRVQPSQFNWLRMLVGSIVVASVAVAGFMWKEPIKDYSIKAYERVSVLTTDAMSTIRTQKTQSELSKASVKSASAAPQKKTGKNQGLAKKSVVKTKNPSLKSKAQNKKPSPAKAAQNKQR
jgi:hypothetical protein